MEKSLKKVPWNLRFFGDFFEICFCERSETILYKNAVHINIRKPPVFFIF
jgi:hypothetical protein